MQYQHVIDKRLDRQTDGQTMSHSTYCFSITMCSKKKAPCIYKLTDSVTAAE